MDKKVALSLLIVLLLLGCAPVDTGPGSANITIVTLGSTVEEKVDFPNTTTLLDSLEKGHDIDATAFRNFIKCVDDVCTNKEYSWAITVNGEYMRESAGSYVLRDRDKIVLRFGERP